MDIESHVRMAVLLVPAAALCLAAFAAPSAQGATKTLVVEAGEQARAHVPMCVDLPDTAAKVKMADGSADVPCQVADGKLWFILDKLAAGKRKSYTVELGAAGPAEAGVALKTGTAQIDVTIDGVAFTSYVFAPKTIGKAVLRRPYFFPAFGPAQTQMMRPYPMVQSGPTTRTTRASTSPTATSTAWTTGRSAARRATSSTRPSRPSPAGRSWASFARRSTGRAWTRSP